MWEGGEDEPESEFDERVDLNEMVMYLVKCKLERKHSFTNEVIPGKLWIGDYESAFNLEGSLLTKHNIECVVSVGSLESSYELCTYDHIKYHRIVCCDEPDQQLYVHFEEATRFIHESGRVLVHCVMGISRSATICIAYLMRYHLRSFHHAFDMVKKARPCIEPNEGFIKQLTAYEQTLKRDDT